MASAKFTRNEVFFLFVDPDSEGEYLPSERDGDSFSDRASGAPQPAAGQRESLAQAETPLPDVDGGDNVSWGRGVHLKVSS